MVNITLNLTYEEARDLRAFLYDNLDEVDKDLNRNKNIVKLFEELKDYV